MFTCFAATSRDMAFEQAPVDEIDVQSICGEVGADWRDLGKSLGLESALIDNIELDHSTNREKAWKVLLKWRQKKKKEATVGILIKALKKTNRKDIVEKLCGM